MPTRLALILFVGSLVGLPVGAQPDSSAPSSSEEEVRAVLETLFDGMRAGDSAAVRAVFHPEARLHTALGPADTAAVRATSVDAFVDAVGQPHERTWDERTWAVRVRVDDPLASAWVPYAFYLGNELSHCGVNAVQFVRQADGWRILQLTDTRRTDCEGLPDAHQ